MCTGAYIAVSHVDHVTTLHTAIVGLEDPGWLCKLPECLMAHARQWNQEVPALPVASHFPELATLGDGDDNRNRLFCCFRVMERPHIMTKSMQPTKGAQHSQKMEGLQLTVLFQELTSFLSPAPFQPPPYCKPGLYLIDLQGTLIIRLPVDSSAAQWLGASMCYVSQCYTRGTKSLSLNFVCILDCHRFKRSYYVFFNLSTLRSLWNKALPFVLSGTQ